MGQGASLLTALAIHKKERRPGGTAAVLERLEELGLQKLSQLRGRLELRNSLQVLEGRSERVRETPDGSRSEFLVLRFEVKVMHGASEVFWSFEAALDECLADDQFGGDVRQFTFLKASTCSRIGSKFRRIRSTSTEMQSVLEYRQSMFATSQKKVEKWGGGVQSIGQNQIEGTGIRADHAHQ
jgi:hypothetical protein